MTQTVTTEKKYSMAQLRASKRSLYVRNNTGLLWTLHEKVGGGQRIDIELRPFGQKDSIVYLPPAALDAPGIARNIGLGKITVSPDLEEEMIELMAGGAAADKALLAQFQVELEQSPHARAIDVKDHVKSRLESVNRKRSVTPQAGQGGVSSMVEEFINPSPIKAADGTMRDATTGEVITAAPAVPDSPTVADLVGKVTLTQSRRVEEN